MKIPGVDHPITVEPANERITVRAAGVPIAESTAALRLTEASYRPVYYLPLTDVRAGSLGPSSHHTYCPFKGKASYFNIVTEAGVIPNAVWTYEKPYQAVAPIAGHVAFYPNLVEITAEGAVTAD